MIKATGKCPGPGSALLRHLPEDDDRRAGTVRWLSRITEGSSHAGRVLPALLMLGAGVGQCVPQRAYLHDTHQHQRNRCAGARRAPVTPNFRDMPTAAM